ncbi:hypothetical protein EJB05_46280, partial [Eragrostis curvula]
MVDNRNRGPTWITGAGFGVLTVNSGLAIYCARNDSASVLFLLLLFGCLRTYERAPPGSPARERARRAVWPLARSPRCSPSASPGRWRVSCPTPRPAPWSGV